MLQAFLPADEGVAIREGHSPRCYVLAADLPWRRTPSERSHSESGGKSSGRGRRPRGGTTPEEEKDRLVDSWDCWVFLWSLVFSERCMIYNLFTDFQKFRDFFLNLSDRKCNEFEVWLPSSK